jgi:hypothetical protein
MSLLPSPGQPSPGVTRSRKLGHDFVEPTRKTKEGKFRQDKPWDDPSIDHWKIEPFAPEDNKGGPFAEESSFATLYPQYREQYLRQVWGQVTKALDKYKIRCELDCVEGLLIYFVFLVLLFF